MSESTKNESESSSTTTAVQSGGTPTVVPVGPGSNQSSAPSAPSSVVEAMQSPMGPTQIPTQVYSREVVVCIINNIEETAFFLSSSSYKRTHTLSLSNPARHTMALAPPTNQFFLSPLHPSVHIYAPLFLCRTRENHSSGYIEYA
jgi:hypothetical protein